MRSIEACEACAWTIATWRRDSGEDPKIKPFRCNSWRHSGECRLFCGAVDFARISIALKKRRNWTYCVLTYPRFDYPNVEELFRAGKDHWNLLRKRIIKRWGEFKYIQTWEVHKSMYPHVNVTISNPGFYQAACDAPDYENAKFLQQQALASGFGKQCWAEPIRNADRMAGYLTKLGLELTGQAVKDQVPVNAPRHFRRIRASRGTLPPRTKNPEITGQLFKMGYDYLSEQLNSPNPDPGGFELEEAPGTLPEGV